LIAVAAFGLAAFLVHRAMQEYIWSEVLESLGDTLGFAVFSSGATRCRFYADWGLSAGHVGRIIVFCEVTIAQGATVGGLAVVIRPDLVGGTFEIASWAVVTAGVVLLITVAIYLAVAAFVHRPVRIRNSPRRRGSRPECVR
jgi:glycosyltransferase 2 family protein